MPIIKKNTVSRSSGGDSPWRNPNSIQRNTLRLRYPNEFAHFIFVSELDEGDLSKQHRIPGVSANGKQFNEYRYCPKENVNETGQIVAGECEFHLAEDATLRRTSNRYSYWVFVYDIYHTQQNPYLGEYEDAVEWELVPVGKSKMYKETVMKPQFLTFSYMLYEPLVAKIARLGTVLENDWEYNRVVMEGQTSYTVEKSDLSPVDVNPKEYKAMIKQLPDLELVVAGIVDEVEFVPLGVPNSSQKSAKDDTAFKNAVDGADEDLPY
jgi:hypothetical protein